MSATLEDKIDSLFGTGMTEEADTSSDTGTNDAQSQNEQTADANAQDGAKPNAEQGTKTGNGEQSIDKGAGKQRGKEPAVAGSDAPTQQQINRRLPANNNGDLVDPSTGNVLAKAGNERRFYEAARNAQGQVNNLRSELERTTIALETFREAAVLPQQLNLQPQEVTAAMHFMAHWKQNPVEAAQKVLTELRAMGYEVDGIGSQVDTKAINQIVRDAIAPFQNDRDAARLEQEAFAQVDRELNQLFTSFPWAEGQQDEINKLLQTDTTLTLREAALVLQGYAYQHGYDLNKPLTPQLLAAKTNGNAQQPAPQAAQPARANNARMSAPSTASDGNVIPKRTTPLGHDRSNRDIVRDAMREAGINVDNI